MTTDFDQNIMRVLIRKSPLNAACFIALGLLAILFEIAALSLSIDAILTVSVNGDARQGKTQLILENIGLDLDNNLLIFFISSICVIYIILIASRYAKRNFLIKLKAVYIEHLSTAFGSVAISNVSKIIKSRTKKVENVLNLVIFGLFCGVLIIFLLIFDASMAVILIGIGISHILLNILLHFYEKRKITVFGRDGRIPNLTWRKLRRHRLDVLEHRCGPWEAHLQKSTQSGHQAALNNMLRGISLAAVLIDLHVKEATVLAIYPILIVFVLGRYHQYLDAFSSNLRRVYG